MAEDNEAYVDEEVKAMREEGETLPDPWWGDVGE